MGILITAPVLLGSEDNCEVFHSLEHLCSLVGILITISSMRCRTRYSATCVSTGRVGAIVGLCGKSLALMHDGELGYALAFIVCLILLSC